jgi:ribose transport system substrate-binding protein
VRLRLQRLIFFTTLALAACGHTQVVATTGSPRPITIGISIQNEQYPFYQAMVAAMTGTAKSYSYYLIVRDANSNYAVQPQQVEGYSTQLRQVEDFIRMGVNAIVLVPVDSQEVDPAILEANAADIPVFTADISDESGEGKVAAIITSDNDDGGRKAGKAVCNAVPKTKSILVLDQPGMTSVRHRVSSFENVVKRCGHHLQELNGGNSADDAGRALTSALDDSSELGAIFAANDAMALGAVQATQNARCRGQQSADKIVIVGYDGSPAAMELFRRGYILAEVVQHPTQLGSVAIQQIHSSLDGRPHPPSGKISVGICVNRTVPSGPVECPWVTPTPEPTDRQWGQCD